MNFVKNKVIFLSKFDLLRKKALQIFNNFFQVGGQFDVVYFLILTSTNVFFKKMGQSRPLFVYFCYFLDTISIIQIEKIVDGVLGIRTQGRRMVGTDKTTELWRPPCIKVCFRAQLAERFVPLGLWFELH